VSGQDCFCRGIDQEEVQKTMSTFPYSAHIGYLFTELPLSERAAAAARAGFDAVEYPAPYAVPAEEMAKWLKSAGLPYTQFGLYSGDANKGEKGIGIFPARRDEFRRSVADALDYAEVINVSMVHAMAGVLPPDRRSHIYWDCYVENLAYAAQEAKKRGVRVIVEPMSAGAVRDYFISTPDQAAHAIAEAGGNNLGLLLDVFHIVSAGLDVHQQIAKHAELIAHVHIADFPGRHEPGSATLDFAAIGRSLTNAGYHGRLGCEYIPAATTEAGLGWLCAARLSDQQAR
jgi:hydroxypyruvate isomerase